MTTKVYSADPRQANRTLETFRRNLLQVQAKSSPSVGVVSNFDPDQRGFVTDTLKGYTMLQQQVGTSTVGRLAVHADYNRIPPGGKEPMRPEPGQPTLIYPVASGSTSASLAFIKGGKVDYRRAYPALELIRNTRTYTFGDAEHAGRNTYVTDNCILLRGDAGPFLNLNETNSWSENSPLPPGLRYYDLEVRATHFLHDQFFSLPAPGAEMPAGFNIGMLLAATHSTLADYRLSLIRSSADIDPFTDYNSYMPHDSQGNIRTNIKPTPDDVFYRLTEEFLDDSYWTGEVIDPLNWQDDYWDGLDRDPTGNTPRVDRDLMKTWLTAHPGAVYTG